jgi:iron-sulfur cluster repair protein YtfE (RIC family)
MTPHTQGTLLFDPALTINEIAARHPETVPVFHRFGFDTCCGGKVCIAEAARRDGIESEPVLAAVNDVLASA